MAKKSGELKDPIVIIGAWNARGLSRVPSNKEREKGDQDVAIIQQTNKKYIWKDRRLGQGPVHYLAIHSPLRIEKGNTKIYLIFKHQRQQRLRNPQGKQWWPSSFPDRDCAFLGPFSAGIIIARSMDGLNSRATYRRSKWNYFMVIFYLCLTFLVVRECTKGKERNTEIKHWPQPQKCL